MIGLYIHIPFCDQICYYCDFPKRVVKEDKKSLYIDTLIKELDYYKDYLVDVKSIYIGGGTPSSLNITLLNKLIKKINIKVEEFTIECNPNDITDEFLKFISTTNINRISLGVQTFNDLHLKTVGRTHSKQVAMKAIKKIKEYKFNLSIDLIYNIPGQTIEDIKEEIKIVKDLDFDHVSYYSLILEDKTVFEKLIRTNKLIPNDEDIDAEMYSLIIDGLKELGFNHYEISNYAKVGKESVHNKIYWQNLEYIGIGMSAAGYLSNQRYSNSYLLKEYQELVSEFGNGIISKTTLTKEDKMFEHLMLGFRLLKGISISDFNKLYETDIFIEFKELKKLIDDKLIIINEDTIKLTKKGLFLNNEVLVRLIK